MTGKGQRTVGVWLAIAAACLGIWASTLWTSATEKAAQDARASEYADAIGGVYSHHEPDPDRTEAFVVIGAGVLLFLSGVIFFATARD